MSAIDQLRRMCSPDVLALNGELFGAPGSAPAKRNKYNARKLTVDGVVFDSKKEYLRWVQLQAMQQAGEIDELQRQVKFVLQEAFVDAKGSRCRQISYTADHTYRQDDHLVVEDVKSVITAKSESFRVRWRMLLNKFRDDPTIICVIYT